MPLLKAAEHFLIHLLPSHCIPLRGFILEPPDMIRLAVPVRIMIEPQRGKSARLIRVRAAIGAETGKVLHMHLDHSSLEIVGTILIRPCAGRFVPVVADNYVAVCLVEAAGEAHDVCNANGVVVGVRLDVAGLLACVILLDGIGIRLSSDPLPLFNLFSLEVRGPYERYV